MLFNYCRHLDFEQKPDYGYFKKGLKNVIDGLGLGVIRPVLDWLNKSPYIKVRTSFFDNYLLHYNDN